MPDVDMKEDRVVACLNLIGATGAMKAEIRYSDDEQPVVWMAVCEHRDPSGPVFTAEGGMSPIEAMFRLVERVTDGGNCTGCDRPTGVSDSWDLATQFPMEDQVCWWKYDPAQKQFIRGCDGKTPGKKKK